MNRVRLAEYVADLVGQEAIELVDAGNGWPSYATVDGPEGDEPVAMYVASVGLTQRGRDEVERRLQVKGGSPIRDDGMHMPLLLGVWHEDPLVDVQRTVLFAADALRRVGNTTQASVFVPLVHLQEAARLGWSTYISTTGEVIECFAPELLPVVVAAKRSEVVLDDRLVQSTITATRLLRDPYHENLDSHRARTRRETRSLVRDARFARRVVAGYDGCCAMCGLDMGIVEAAHILPVAAAYDDSPRNGLALCPNHHRLFDRHAIGVHPDSGAIMFHPDALWAARTAPDVARLIDTTFTNLNRPRPGHEPDRDAFLSRYEYFAGYYDWLE